MMQALGAQLLDSQGNQVPRGAEGLLQLDHLDVSKLDPRLKDCRFRVACDVINPLTGPSGAAAVFGPQKGATPDMVQTIEKALQKWAAVIQRDLKIDVLNMRHGGAAGGGAAAMKAFLGAELESGAEMILQLVGFDEKIQRAHLVIVGEGKLDG